MLSPYGAGTLECSKANSTLRGSKSKKENPVSQIQMGEECAW